MGTENSGSAGWMFDEEVEDAESAAGRLIKMLGDLPHDTARQELLQRAFGVPLEERYSETWIRQRWSIDRPIPLEDRHEWQLLREEMYRERGELQVAIKLLFEWRDEVEAIAFAGHEAGPGFGPSTNLSAFREAVGAFNRVQVLRAHAFGGCSLEDCGAEIQKLEETAVMAMVEAVRWAIRNNLGMPTPA